MEIDTVDYGNGDFFAKAGPTSDATFMQTTDDTRQVTLPSPRFAVDERVYARDYDVKDDDGGNESNYKDNISNDQQGDSKPRYYKAVVRKLKWSTFLDTSASREVNPDGTHVQQQQWMYLVHYEGWNARWDRWLNEDSLIPFSEAEKADNNINIVQKRKTSTGSNNNNAGNVNSSNKKRRVTSTSALSLDERQLAFSDVCSLPLTLQIVLVDEYERLHRNVPGMSVVRSVHVLPAKVTVKQVLNHFQKRYTAEQPAVVEFCKSMLKLFQVALPNTLLYACERPQFDQLKLNSNDADPVEWADVYSPEFLLRLYVRLPYLLPSNVVNPNNNSNHNNNSSNNNAKVNDSNNNDNHSTSSPMSDPVVLGRFLADLLVLMQRNRSSIFASPSQYRLPEYPHEWTHFEVANYGSSHGK